MKKNILYLILVLNAVIIGCQSPSNISEDEQDPEQAKIDLFNKVYSDNNLKSQLFTINNDRDTSIVTENGTIYRIYNNSFVLSNNATAPSNIEIEIKEALSPVDFVMANLTTTSDGEILESGGMVYINATANDQQLQIAEGKEIGVMLPDDSILDGMSIYEGEKTDNRINWAAPEPVLNSKLKSLERSFTTVTYYHHGDETASTEEHKKVDDWLWLSGRKAGDEVTIGQSKIEVLSFSTNVVSLKESSNGVFTQDVIINKGQNGFVEDFNTSYIFSVKKLGWANIDRLFSDPKSEEVDILVSIDNNNEFGYVFTSLILPDHNMYIPGYQKKDENYNFTHNDTEKMILPIGAKATILATAYKDDKPYFCIKNITITKDFDLSMSLKPIKLEDLKKELERQI